MNAIHIHYFQNSLPGPAKILVDKILNVIFCRIVEKMAEIRASARIVLK
jgi:hypothetical protein